MAYRLFGAKQLSEPILSQVSITEPFDIDLAVINSKKHPESHKNSWKSTFRNPSIELRNASKMTATDMPHILCISHWNIMFALKLRIIALKYSFCVKRLWVDFPVSSTTPIKRPYLVVTVGQHGSWIDGGFLSWCVAGRYTQPVVPDVFYLFADLLKTHPRCLWSRIGCILRCQIQNHVQLVRMTDQPEASSRHWAPPCGSDRRLEPGFAETSSRHRRLAL